MIYFLTCLSYVDMIYVDSEQDLPSAIKYGLKQRVSVSTMVDTDVSVCIAAAHITLSYKLKYYHKHRRSSLSPLVCKSCYENIWLIMRQEKSRLAFHF